MKLQANQAEIAKAQVKPIPSCNIVYQLLKLRQGECFELNGQKMQMVSIGQVEGKGPEGRVYLKMTAIFYNIGKKKG